MQAYRARNKMAGLCLCGQARRPATTRRDGTVRESKTCQYCYDSHAGAPPLPTSQRPKQTHAAFHADVDPDVLSRFHALCVQYDMPVAQALDDALEMYISVTEGEGS